MFFSFLIRLELGFRFRVSIDQVSQFRMDTRQFLQGRMFGDARLIWVLVSVIKMVITIMLSRPSGSQLYF